MVRLQRLTWWALVHSARAARDGSMLIPFWLIASCPINTTPTGATTFPKMSFKVGNRPAYEAGLRRRGSLTLWIEDAALECWQMLGPGGQARYTGAAIQTSLMLGAAFKLALRQIEGLMTSVLSLMGLTISSTGSHDGQPSRGDVTGHPSDLHPT